MIAANINGTGVAVSADMLGRVTYSSGTAMIDLGGGNSITIQNITADSLTADDFTIF